MAIRADLTIGALSRRAGVKVETIRYYERTGLLAAPPRSAGGHRLYREEDARRLLFIRRCRELGFGRDEIGTLLGLVDGDASCGEVQAVALDHLARIRARIADLRRMARTLADTAARCQGGAAPQCPIIQSLSAPSPPARQPGRTESQGRMDRRSS